MKSSVILWVVAASVNIYLFLYNYHKLASTPSAWVIFEQPLEYINYVFNYLGAPLVTFSNRLHELPLMNRVPLCNKGAFLAGLIGLIVCWYTSWLLIRWRYTKLRDLVPYISLSLYSIGAAIVTGFGRAGLGSDQALSSRYVTISSLFWISNVVLLYLLASTHSLALGPNKENKLRKYALFSILVIVVLIALSSAHRTVSARNRYHYLSVARNELLSVKKDVPYVPVRPVYPDADIVRKRLDILRRYHLSIFRKSTSSLGPKVIDAKVQPGTVPRDGSGRTLITASVSDPDGDFGDSSNMTVDLNWRLFFRRQEMYDDGTHGDVDAGDGVYSYLAQIPKGISDNAKILLITATDDANNKGGGTVKLYVIDPHAIYVDNSDAEFICGDWICVSGLSGASEAYGNDYCYHKAGDGSCKAIWRPSLPKAGNYNVYAWWTSECPNRAHDAKYTIYHDGGSDTKEVSQMVNAAKWNYLGMYHFATGTSGYVVLGDDASAFVIADAIKWEPK